MADVEVTEIGDNFSPLKLTMRDLNEAFDRSPSLDAFEDCANKTVPDEDLLRAAGFLKRQTKVGHLRKVVEAARSIAVLQEEDGDRVAPGFEFLGDKPQASKEECLAVISRLFELSKLDSVVKLGIGLASMTNHNQLVFIKAVTARALDAQVIRSLDSSGLLQKEWAAASIFAANEDKQMQVQHVTAYLLNKHEWVFGDYVPGLGQFSQRLLLRQFHRVLASDLERVLSPSEVQRFTKQARKAKKWATSAEDFQKVIDAIVELSKAPVATPTKPSKKQRVNDSSDHSDTAGMTQWSATSDQQGPMTEWSESEAEGPYPQFVGSGRRGSELSAEEVANWLSDCNIEKFDDFRSDWFISGEMVTDLTQKALMKKVQSMGMGAAMAFEVFEHLTRLPDTIVPPVPRRQVSFRDGAGRPVSIARSNQSSYGLGAEQQLGTLFGSGARQVSLYQIRNDPRQAKHWLGCSTLMLASGQPSFGRVVGVDHGPPLAFVVKEDRVEGEHMRWSPEETMKALSDFRDFHSVIPSHAQDTSSVVRRVGEVGRAKTEIRLADKDRVDAALEKAWHEMRTTGTYDGLGFGPGGLLDGESARAMWDLLRAGGQSFAQIVNHKAVQWVLNRVSEMLKERDVLVDYNKLARVVFHVGGKDALVSLTCLNPSKKTGGITKDHPERVQKVDCNADGSLCFRTVEEDHRIKKDWDTFGFSRNTFKKLFDIWEVVHSRHITGNWWLDVDNLLEELLWRTGPGDVIDPMDVLMSLIWDHVPTMFTAGLDEACAKGVAPWEVFRHKGIEPPSWKQKQDRVIIQSSMNVVRELRRKVGQLEGDMRTKIGRGGNGTGGGGSGGGKGAAVNNQGGSNSSRKGKQGNNNPGGGNSNGSGRVTGGQSGGGGGRRTRRGNKGAAGDSSSRDLSGGALNNDRDPNWDRFDPAVKTWCESEGYGSVHAARSAWQSSESNKGLCFWTCSDLGKIMGGKCRRGDQCHFKDSH